MVDVGLIFSVYLASKSGEGSEPNRSRLHKIDIEMKYLKLSDRWFHLHVPETDSTMIYLRTHDLEGRNADFSLVTTDFQTAGRGQRGHSWESAPGENLIFSFVCHPRFLEASRQFLLSEALSLAVAEALDHVVPNITVKWPNDIYYGDKKICGMLLEHDLSGSYIDTTITGVGVNVNQDEFTGDAPNPVSLRQILGRSVEREAIMEDILAAFERYYSHIAEGNAGYIENHYSERLYRRYGKHGYHDARGDFEAEIEEILPDGRIVLKDADGNRRVYAFKEVSFR